MDKENVLIINTENELVKSKEESKTFPIYDDKHPILSQYIPEYTSQLPNNGMTNLVSKLQATRKKYGGIGLSANQCGITARVFVMGTESFDIVCINPKIISTSIVCANEKEGCLSYPGIYFRVKRPTRVTVEYTDLEGNIIQETFDGLTARCFQHELDHLNGINFTDHAGKMKLYLARKNKKKRVKSILKKKLDKRL